MFEELKYEQYQNPVVTQLDEEDKRISVILEKLDKLLKISQQQNPRDERSGQNFYRGDLGDEDLDDEDA